MNQGKTEHKVRDIDFKNYRPTGVAAVDTLVAYIYAHRLARVPVKFINVKPEPWEQLKWYFRDLVDQHMSDDFELVLDRVTVRRGTAMQAKAFESEIW